MTCGALVMSSMMIAIDSFTDHYLVILPVLFAGAGVGPTQVACNYPVLEGGSSLIGNGREVQVLHDLEARTKQARRPWLPSGDEARKEDLSDVTT